MDNSLYSKFLSLLNEEYVDGTYRGVNISEHLPHMIGCSKEGYPILFIATSDNAKTSDIKLEIVSVMFNRECNVHEVDTAVQSTKKFSVIQLNSHNTDLQRYFIEVTNLVLLRLGSTPTTAVLKSEIGKVIQLFTISTPISMEIVRGLWAELLVIDRSVDPDYLVRSWHVTPEDKYDFNNGESKLEVKSTAGTERKHVFSLEQLNPEAGTDLTIASIFVTRTGIGKSVFDLMDSISHRLGCDACKLKLREMILSTIGAHIDEVSGYYFDYSRAIAEYQLFNYKDIPGISKVSVPSTVTKVSFTSDLSGITPLTKDKLSNSQLFSKL